MGGGQSEDREGEEKVKKFMSTKNYLRSQERQVNAWDRQGLIEYTTGDEVFDEKIAREWFLARPQEISFTSRAEKDKRYEQEKIEEDLAGIRRIENSPDYKKERSPVSVLAEIVMLEGVRRGLLLGEGSTANITSRYDDIKLGADMVVVIPNPEDPEEDLAFCLDITVSDDDAVLDKKISSEFIKLRKKQRTNLKYSRNVKGPINRYILGIPPEQAKDLSEILLGQKSDQEVENLIQFELAEELINQARWQAAYALARHGIVSLNQAENIDDFLNLVADQQTQRLIKSRLTPDLQDSVRVNLLMVKAMKKQLNSLNLDKEKEDSAIANPPHQVDFPARFRPEWLQGLQRAA